MEREMLVQKIKRVLRSIAEDSKDFPMSKIDINDEMADKVLLVLEKNTAEILVERKATRQRKSLETQ